MPERSSSLREVLSEQPISWCCIDRLNRYDLSEGGPQYCGYISLCFSVWP